MKPGDWLESRIGWRRLLALALDEPVPGGARWLYIPGSVTAFLLILQAATGVLLASYYAPSASTAWASVATIQDTVAGGWFIRGLHSFGASAMVVMTTLHLGQVLLYGAYKAPREINWLAGVLMLGMVLGFALTGYLLPWDQKGYWATQVATSIIGTMPLVGRALQELVQGGAAYGSYTLTRFYALHTYVLPASVFGVLAFHVYLFRRHGVTPPAHLSAAELDRRTQPFWPDQLLRDVVGCAVVFAVMVLLVVRGHGVELEAPADPASSYIARPEWYFLPLFQLLKYFEGPLEIVGTMVIPGLAGGLLAALPFLDRSPDRSLRARLPVLAGAGAALAGLVALGLLARASDERDPMVRRQRAEATEIAERARSLAKKGVLPEGGTAVWRNDPEYRARELWGEHCKGCHSLDGRGGEKGPDLLHYDDRAWLTSFLHDPNGRLRMGPARLDKGMKPVEAPAAEVAALVELVYAESGAADADRALVERGRALFADKDCDSCHDLDGSSENDAPNLGGRGTFAYVRRIIEDASSPLLYGKHNKMPRFGSKLAPSDIDELARFVVGRKQAP